ncbi:MAG: hypothetical protein PHO48_03610 [Candidatus Gracilibacteria bacterium]|nr:hypothetical protein [Candidatus Gracilibacteria bacterium]MDD5178881.1 hypothetical protein [Candidatus Gracilibacteria bacterium]
MNNNHKSLLINISVALLTAFSTFFFTRLNFSRENLIQTKSNIYGETIELVSNWAKSSRDSSYAERSKILIDELKSNFYKIRVFGSSNVIQAYSCALESINEYYNFVHNESPAHTYTDYGRMVIPSIYNLEKAFREDIGLMDKIPKLQKLEGSMEGEDVNLVKCNLNEIQLDSYR